MKFARIFILLLLIHGILPQASYANPNTPNAATLAWDKIYVSTGEGIDVWLRINVVGAAPTEHVNLKFIYQTFGVQAIANEDYEPTPWPGIRGTISGTDRVAYIKITIKRNTNPEPVEYFHVELRSDASNTVISSQARMYVYIARSRIMNPVVGTLEPCVHVGEPNNDFAASAGEIAANGGWCNSNFNGETVRALDYYRVTQNANGTLVIRMENTTPNQHDLDLYLYYRDGNGQYQSYRESINGNQQAEYISAPIAGNTNYLIGVYWAISTTNNVTPTYRLSVTYQP